MKLNNISDKVLYVGNSNKIENSPFDERFQFFNRKNINKLDNIINQNNFSLIILEITNKYTNEELLKCIENLNQYRLPVMFICNRDLLSFINNLNIPIFNDFIISPYNADELFYRCNKLINEFNTLQVKYNDEKIESMKELLSNISHHWRQPLNVISISAHNVKSFDIKSDDREKFLSYIIDSCMDLSSVIDLFKEVYTVDRKCSNVLLEDEIRLLLDNQEKYLDDNKVKLIINNNMNADYKINIVKNEITNLLSNIINNSIDSYANSKSRNKIIILDVFEDSDSLNFIVKDKGVGYNSNKENKFLEPYYSSKNTNDNLGLGLFLTNIIVKNKLNGEMSLKRIDNETVFNVKIPHESIKA